MRYHARLLALLPVLVLVSCGGGDGDSDIVPQSAGLGQEYLVGFGETIHIGSLSLEFTTLADESRCPLNATCVWEGNARILVTATRGHATGVVALNTFSGYGSQASFEGYLIELRRLDPYPPWSPRGPLEDYVATLFVDRASP